MKKKDLIEFIEMEMNHNEALFSDGAMSTLTRIRDELLNLQEDTMRDKIAARDEEKDLMLLADEAVKYFRYDGSCEYGSVGTDCKRPFGNSNVHGDMAEILGLLKSDDDYYNLSADDQEVIDEYVSTLYTEKLPDFFKRKWQEFRSK